MSVLFKRRVLVLQFITMSRIMPNVSLHGLASLAIALFIVGFLYEYIGQDGPD